MNLSRRWVFLPTLSLFFIVIACAGRIAWVKRAEAATHGKITSSEVVRASVNLIDRLGAKTDGLSVTTTPIQMVDATAGARIWMVDFHDRNERSLMVCWNADSGRVVQVSNSERLLGFERGPIRRAQTAHKIALEWRHRLGMRGDNEARSPRITEGPTAWQVFWMDKPRCILRLDKESGALSFGQTLDFSSSVD